MKKEPPKPVNVPARNLALPIFRPVIVPDAKKKAASKSRQRQRARLRKLHPEGDH